MKKLFLLDVLQSENCPFCKSSLVLRMCWYNSTLKQSCSISEDGIFNYNTVSIALGKDSPNLYWLGDDRKKFYPPEEEMKHSDNYHFVKECYKCSHRYCVYTSGLVFSYGYVLDLHIDKIKFQVDVDNNENFIVTQDLSENKTKVIFSKLKEAYPGILLPDNRSLEMPLIKFNFDNPSAIINRIKTLTILS